MPGETKAQPAYAPMRPTWFGKRAKRWRRTPWVEARGTKKTSLSFWAGAIVGFVRESQLRGGGTILQPRHETPWGTYH